ncbi:LrgB family protein [Glaciecola sp. SC05]|uniref:LrgB family protein n=1 Tax=Glaciecola sp. SC05 TaxID=1987355 RepID=UPI00352910D1
MNLDSLLSFQGHIVWLSITLAAYVLSLILYQKANSHPALHPLIISSTLIICSLFALDVVIEDYLNYVWLLAFLLGPATVALAIPLYNQLAVLIRMGWRVVAPIFIGGTIAPILAWLSVYFFDTPVALQMTVLVKSITTPLAMGTAEAIGGIGSLAAVLVVLTGIVGAVFAPLVFQLAKTHSEMAQGVALGTVAHAVGTSKAISISETCAAFATLSVCLNGIVTALMLPLLFAS